MMVLYFGFILAFHGNAIAEVCESNEPGLIQSAASAQLMNAKKDCERSLFKENSPQDSQHACACRNYTGDLTDRDLFEAKFKPQILQVKKQYELQVAGDPLKEKKLLENLYANYLRAKDNLPCGNEANIYPNVKVGLSSTNGGFYCASNPKSAATMNLPLCSDKAKANASKEKVTKEIMEISRKNFGTIEQALSKQYVCDPSAVDKKNWTLTSQNLPPCSLSFEKKFQDNTAEYQSGITDESVQTEIQGSECYQKIKKEGLEVDHIDIETSSSLLANTGSAASMTFKQLSEMRAEKIKAKVFQKISGLEEVSYTVNASGKNGDGTSGPCPYVHTRSAPHWARRNDIKDAVLDENKYVRAKIYYKSKSNPLSGTGHRVSLTCSTVHFGCSPKDAFSSTSFK